MPRMTDEQFREAAAICRDLYDFLNKHGEDDDEFSGVFRELDTLLQSGRLPKEPVSND